MTKITYPSSLILIAITIITSSCKSYLQINSFPSGAKVYNYKNKYLGETPLFWIGFMKSGSKNILKLKKEGYQDYSLTLNKDKTYLPCNLNPTEDTKLDSTNHLKWLKKTNQIFKSNNKNLKLFTYRNEYIGKSNDKYYFLEMNTINVYDTNFILEKSLYIDKNKYMVLNNQHEDFAGILVKSEGFTLLFKTKEKIIAINTDFQLKETTNQILIKTSKKEEELNLFFSENKNFLLVLSKNEDITIYDNNLNPINTIKLEKGLINANLDNEGGLHLLYYESENLNYQYFNSITEEENNVDITYNSTYKTKSFKFNKVDNKVYISSLLCIASSNNYDNDDKTVGGQLSIIDLAENKEIEHQTSMFKEDNMPYKYGLLYMINRGVQVVKDNPIQLIETCWNVFEGNKVYDIYSDISLLDFKNNMTKIIKRPILEYTNFKYRSYEKVYGSYYATVKNDQLLMIYNNKIIGGYVLNQIMLDENLSIKSELSTRYIKSLQAINIIEACEIEDNKTLFFGKNGKYTCPVILTR